MAGTGSGCTFGIGATPTNIGEITSISGYSSEIGMIDVTTLANDGNKTYISGLRDNADIEITCNYDFEDDGQTALKAAHDSGASTAFAFTMTNLGCKLTGNCIVKKWGIENFEVEGVVQCKVSLQVLGKPTLAEIE